MKYAVIESGGKQYRVSEGDVLDLERLNTSEKEISFEKILLYVSDGAVKFGAPTVADATVKAEVMGDIRGEKLYVSKFKSKVRHRRTTGHRQELTKVKIQEISLKGEVKAKEAPVKEAAEEPKTRRVRKTAAKKTT